MLSSNLKSLCVLIIAATFLIACKNNQQPSLTGEWTITSIASNDTTGQHSAGGVAAVAWLSVFTNGTTIRFSENGEYEITTKGKHSETGKYSVAGDSISLTKADGSAEINAFSFKGDANVDIMSETMKLSLEKN